MINVSLDRPENWKQWTANENAAGVRPEFAFLAFNLDSIMWLSRYVFHFYVVSALQLLPFYLLKFIHTI